MKRILKVFVLLLFLGVAFIVVNLLFTNSFNKLELPILSFVNFASFIALSIKGRQL